MLTTRGDSSALQAEIAAFYSGFGQPELLVTAFAEAVLLIPITDDDRILVSQFEGVGWICAFTSVAEFARFQARRAVVPDREYRYHTVRGRRLAAHAASRPDSTGVVVDTAGAAPIGFPPQVGDMPPAGTVAGVV
ncbi:SseB family protein [Nocardia vaccinii]|uniref:SseB family protein n=1 Tax=Nocardia vaccinii TaxID=1822 RepID=UPI000A7C86CB|nr:SseB family protein [Nocardia vaccinii]